MKSIKVIIGLAVVAILTVGVLIAGSQVVINGKNVIFWSKDEIIDWLMEVQRTKVCFENQEVDVTDSFVAEKPDVNKRIGNQVIDVDYTIDRGKLEDILDSKLKIDKYQAIDYDAIISHLEEGDTLDISKYVSWLHPKKTIRTYKGLKKWSYSFDKKGLSLSWKDVEEHVEIGDKVKVDYSFLDDFLKRVEKEYNTIGEPVKFRTRSGKKIKTSSNYWGNQVDVSGTKKAIKRAMKKLKSVKNARPVFTQETGELGNDYIEVSISKQKVWLIKNGKVKMSSPCVTGTKGSHDTPKGIYRIIERRPEGKTLKGADYETWVNKWMRITWEGVGLHDADWRSSFGGSIYKYNGSHGCINLPYSFASKLCSAVDWGFPVIVY